MELLFHIECFYQGNGRDCEHNNKRKYFSSIPYGKIIMNFTTICGLIISFVVQPAIIITCCKFKCMNNTLCVCTAQQYKNALSQLQIPLLSLHNHRKSVGCLLKILSSELLMIPSLTICNRYHP